MIIFLFLPLFAQAYQSPGAPAGFVNDYAGVLSSEENNKLEDKLSAFEKETSNEISVVVIKSLDNDTVENFAVKLFEEWKIGKTGKDNGVLILAAIEDRKMKIEVGYGLEGALTDAQSSWIIKDVLRPAFQDGNYYIGFDGAVDRVIAATKGEYVPSDDGGESADGFDPDMIGLISFVMFIPIWLASILARSKSWWAGGVLGGLIGVVVTFIFGFMSAGLVALAVLIPVGLLFDYVVSKTYQKNKDSGSFPWWIGGGRGGGFGGFGRSGGGGFGGFGGGRSGGGGASGGW